MSFKYDAPPQQGDWVTMRDMAKLGEPLVASVGFLHDDPTNLYKGDACPRYIIVAKSKSTGDDVKVSCPKGYGRDGFFEALKTYLDANPGETVDIKFVTVTNSNYIDVTTAD